SSLPTNNRRGRFPACPMYRLTGRLEACPTFHSTREVILSTTISAMEWTGGPAGHLRLLDQTRLPRETVWLDCERVDDVWWAIKKLSVRGAPAIGIAAAYGVVLAASEGRDEVFRACDHLATSRPTAVI